MQNATMSAHSSAISMDSSRKRQRDSSTSSPDTLHDSKRTKASHTHSSKSSLPSSSANLAPSDSRDRISTLSDELLIRILHHLPLETILLVQSISHRFSTLAIDSQIWKSLYYTRFVLPRALKARKGEDEEGRWHFASRRSRWLDEERLLEWETGNDNGNRGEEGRIKAAKTDWKARYRLRHNWSRGKAEVRRVGMGGVRDGGAPVEDSTGSWDESADSTKLMVRLVNGIVITANGAEGLRAWDVKSKDRKAEEALASIALTNAPTSLGIDSSTSGLGTSIAVGFSDGGFGIWTLQQAVSGMIFDQRFIRMGATAANRRLTAVAYAHPYLLTISAAQSLSLYSFAVSTDDTALNTTLLPEPTLLTSLMSQTTWPPLTLSLRPTPNALIASIAYSLPTYTSGWSVGLQELHLEVSTGNIIKSRLSSAAESGFHSLLSSTSPSSLSGSATPTSFSPGERTRTDGRGHGQAINAKPTSLSYSHPYLLAGHADNTLTLYLVSSTPTDLRIGKGVKLWGHTSEVQGAMIGGRGRAVSVGGGPGGGEVRVWELEGGGAGIRRGGERSVRVVGDSEDASGGDGEDGDSADSGTVWGNDQALQRGTKGWVGFDDEVVVVMREGGAVVRGGHKSELMVYDFT